MFIALDENEETFIKVNSLEELYAISKAEEFNLDDLLVYELGPEVHYEIKIVRKQLPVTKER
jgi:hypothetical protein